jgi:hypothetical protein
MAITKNSEITSADKDVAKRQPYTLLVGMQINTAIMGITMEVSQEI